MLSFAFVLERSCGIVSVSFVQVSFVQVSFVQVSFAQVSFVLDATNRLR